MSNTIFSQVKGFCTQTNGAPAKALSLILSSMDHMILHRDWDALAWFLGHAPANYRGPAKRIVLACLGGVTYDSQSKLAKAHRCKGIFKMGDNFGPTDKMEALRKLVADGEKLTGKAVSEAFPSLSEPVQKSEDEKAKALAKSLKARLERDGIKWADLVALMVQPEPNF
jgi:hypothetical protein